MKNDESPECMHAWPFVNWPQHFCSVQLSEAFRCMPPTQFSSVRLSSFELRVCEANTRTYTWVNSNSVYRRTYARTVHTHITPLRCPQSIVPKKLRLSIMVQERWLSLLYDYAQSKDVRTVFFVLQLVINNCIQHIFFLLCCYSSWQILPVSRMTSHSNA